MDSIPDAWPPGPEDAGVLTAPLFPLPDVWLFPRVVMPLHIFEPRYREMIEDSMDGPGRIVMGTIVPGHEDEMPGAPPIHAVAGVGEILRHDRTEDGRFVIQLLGLERVTIRELESDKPYRRVAYEPLQEPPASEEEDAELRPALLEAIQARLRKTVEIPGDAPLGVLADILLIRLELPHAELHGLYAQSDPVRRARGALAAHAQKAVSAEPGEDETDGGETDEAGDVA